MFNSLNYLFNTAIVGILAYVGIIILLRISGKRTLSKWNSFDFVVTIAFGSILAAMLLSSNTSLAQGLLGFGLLVLFQYLLTWIAARSPIIQQLIKAKPTLLLYQGKILDSALKNERVSEGEILAAIRASGISSVEDVEAVVLETDGSFSVIKEKPSHSDSAFKDVQGYNSHLSNLIVS
ncbi:hypothetical protein cce_1661 [Crocosphaera subtropica ATCC 51142]|uniref:DUF421 domain-containing protein n=1 Tax=Crocosphaera subtropica (strain ATCC 51142 / BH68) TaxID=43989 RepID=B1WYJ4_CROS5|nr:YetF domain-containing protein [Crocosphaera subtropica]ACB51011.1 hypothetical protein cce_1661 [Crocosphaera subtropica ATCC 51142]